MLPKFNTTFLQDFADLMSVIILDYGRILIVGDFNIHVLWDQAANKRRFDLDQLF